MYFWITTGVFLALVVFLIIRDLRKPDQYCDQCIHVIPDEGGYGHHRCKLSQMHRYITEGTVEHEWRTTKRFGGNRHCKKYAAKEVNRISSHW
jgi:hypothetical protein